MKNETQEAKKYLQAVIPNLDRFSSLSGTEGTVYFVDDDFVVKRYFEPIESLEMFEEFFREVQSFSEKGYAVPKMYSWDYDLRPYDDGFLVYTLQERLGGKMLFDISAFELYEQCKEFCSRKEFDVAVADRNNNPELLGLLIREFISGCLRTNKALLGMSEAELERFISTDFNISSQSRFSMPDVQAGNVMFDGERLSIIDNGYLGYDKGIDSVDSVKANLIRDVILLFYNNEMANWLPKFRCMYSDQIKRLSGENMEASFLAMRRFVRKVNQMYRPVMSNKYDFDACESMANAVFDEKKAKEICAEIQRSF